MAMTDAEIENLIMDVIRQRGITWDDMVGGPSLRFDKGEEVVYRQNIFQSPSWSRRFIELLTPNPDDPTHKVIDSPSLSDLMRFWWNTCASHEDVIEEMLEDLFTVFKDMLSPPPEETPEDKPLEVDFREIVGYAGIGPNLRPTPLRASVAERQKPKGRTKRKSNRKEKSK